MLHAKHINKTFASDGVSTPALIDVDFTVEPGEFVAIVGRSGSGKTTFLNVLSTLLAPDSGELVYQGEDVTCLPGHKLNRLRQRDFSIVFQFHHLLPYLTARENVLLPSMNGLKPISAEASALADTCLERVGLGGKGGKLPGHLSGGEQQRVAIARALAKDTKVLFADEPTGNLDKGTGDAVMDLLGDLGREGIAVVMVTHDRAHAARADRILPMADGRVVDENIL